MGGFGAVKWALHHPDLDAFVGGISAAIDVPRRPFFVSRFEQSRRDNSIFGQSPSQTHRDNDPFVLAGFADPEKKPYFFLSCGDQEGLLSSSREFAALLGRRHFRYEFHRSPGAHDWKRWNERLPVLFQSLQDHRTSDANPKH
jgi:putative tributyrin esterase